MRPLTNDGWGFASNCFVCEATNQHGLRIPFHHDEERDAVVADFTLDDAFSGAPTYVHGGVVLAVMDEAMAWAAIAVAGTWAVTRTTTASFGHPVRVGRPYRVEARVGGRDGDDLHAAAVVLDAKGRPCAEASAVFAVLGPAQAIDATGGEVSAANARYLSDG